jgi:lysophospholipase L1-like esterase
MKYKVIIILLTILIKVNSNAMPLKFDFGNGKTAKGYNSVNSSTIYDDTHGYGFDFGTKAECNKTNNNPLTGDFCTSLKPFYFSVKLHEGNYKVTVYITNANGNSYTTIKAESRRLMLEKIQPAKGEIIKKTFCVNVRIPKINDSISIKIKPREATYLNWDNKLTFEITGHNPCICAIEIEETYPITTIFLAGNSTVTDQEREPYASWGQMITRFLSPDVVVANYAESGESLHSFYNSNRLAKILSLIKPGDYLFIEFGHNDQKLKGEGIGPWTSFTNYLELFIDETLKKGAYPVLVTPLSRRSFDSSGFIINTHGEYLDAVRAVAKNRNVPLIDLNTMSKTLYETMGIENSKKLLCHYPANTYPGQDKKLEDNTHFNNFGAYQIAKCVLQGIIDNNLNIKNYILKDFNGYNPSLPDSFEKWDFPESIFITNTKPEGN